MIMIWWNGSTSYNEYIDMYIFINWKCPIEETTLRDIEYNIQSTKPQNDRPGTNNIDHFMKPLEFPEQNNYWLLQSPIVLRTYLQIILNNIYKYLENIWGRLRTGGKYLETNIDIEQTKVINYTNTFTHREHLVVKSKTQKKVTSRTQKYIYILHHNLLLWCLTLTF